MIYKIGDNGLTFDARIEVEGSSVIIHSRGGPTGGRPPRNQEHEEALKTIVRRLRANDAQLKPIIRRVLLDSAVARRRPLDERVLADAREMSGLSNEEVVTLILSRARKWGQKPGAKGGNSTKQLRIEINDLPRHSIITTLRLRKWTSSEAKVELLPYETLRRVTSEQIERAVGRLVSGEDAPNFGPSRDYDVVTDEGDRLAPKKVFGLALEEALGIEAHPGHFHAGWGKPCFDLIEAAQFRIYPKNAQIPTPAEFKKEIGTVPLSDEDRSYIEGDKRMAKHLRTERKRASAAARNKRAQIIRDHGRLICEHCTEDYVGHFGPAIAAGCFEIHHTVPLASLNEKRPTKLSDLVCLCATCHRATHRAMVLKVALPKP